MWRLLPTDAKCPRGDPLLLVVAVLGPWLSYSPWNSSLLYSLGYMLPLPLREDFKGQRHLMKFLLSRALGFEAHYV